MDDSVRGKIMAIMRDPNLTDEQKARKRQDLMSGKQSKTSQPAKGDGSGQEKLVEDETLKCIICMDMCERPVTAPCQHNFCLACFKRWVGQAAKNSCPTCREAIPRAFINNPKVNTALAMAIRMTKNNEKRGPLVERKTYQGVDNEDRPDKAFVTERAKKTGRANASSGKIMVRVPKNHFGPILPEHDPTRGRGVLVGDFWQDRLDCRQWGAHFPHVAGIAGQGKVGAQSVVLSGGYEDDRDEGEWFLYTGSGGRDLTGNKRVTKHQSSDQVFKLSNEALRISCIRGLPVRVVRSCKERNSAYAPSTANPVRYDGIYRILRAWRFKGKQEFLMCRYLFVRCDNAAAPWSTSDDGDMPNLEIPKDALKEINQAQGNKVYEMCDDPFWDYNEETKTWDWTKDTPAGDTVVTQKRRKPMQGKARKRLRNEFKCGKCSKIMKDPVSTPCGHSFCKSCLDKEFAGRADTVNRTKSAGRTLRNKKNAWPCPWLRCGYDLCDFLKNAQVNRTMAELIDRLRKQEEDGKETPEEKQEEKENDGAVDVKSSASDDMEDCKEEDEEDEGPSTFVRKTTAEKEAEQQAMHVASLCAEFPGFDQALIEGLMADQGGDVEEVKGYLVRMSRMKKSKPKKAVKRTRDSEEEYDDVVEESEEEEIEDSEKEEIEEQTEEEEEETETEAEKTRMLPRRAKKARATTSEADE
ncbi:hypothetical protein BSKO_01246 [Bryopsis sp. KO-2023]|nr:hypothetical protein BSKO_01246 [Bryopsis sp. KO-2023]